MAKSWETPGSVGVAMATFERASRSTVANRFRGRVPLEIGIGYLSCYLIWTIWLEDAEFEARCRRATWVAMDLQLVDKRALVTGGSDGIEGRLQTLSRRRSLRSSSWSR